MLQQEFFDIQVPSYEGMPATRYQGSKRKLLPWLYEVISGLEFRTALDPFGGTGSVTHLLRFMGKEVHYNDILPANAVIAEGLFANTAVMLTDDALRSLFRRKEGERYSSTIAEHFGAVYFTDEENTELDTICQNIPRLRTSVERAEAYYCLFQAALSKRPYNLFHRANLDMRFRDVSRGFGNKATWDKTFLDHMLKFLHELRQYRVRQSTYPVHITCEDAFSLEGRYDLVYIDTPYAKSEGAQESNYFNFYHFLDAMLDYANLQERLLDKYCHKPIYPPNKLWYPQENVEEAFRALLGKYRNSIRVISYRSDGYPTPEKIVEILKESGATVQVEYSGDYKYVLASRKTNTTEIVIVAT